MHKMHFGIIDASECIALDDQVSDSDDDVHKLLWHSIPFKINKLAPCSYCTAATHTCTHTPTRSLTNLGQMSLWTAWTPAKVDSAFGRSIREQISSAKCPALSQNSHGEQELKPTQTHTETCRKVQRGPTDPSKPAELPKHADQTNIWIKATRYEQVCCFWIRRMDSYCVRISKSIHVKLEMLQKQNL